MFLEGVLIPARSLVDDVSVVRAEPVERVDYFHIELDTHDVILAEGAPSETFLDDGSRGMFHNAEDYRTRYPSDTPSFGRFCAPRVEAGYFVEEARRKIAARAGRVVEIAGAGPLRGRIESAQDGRITGWAQNVAYPDASVCLDILLDGRLLGRTLANRHRADLEALGIGDGKHAFEFRLPAGVDITRAQLQARRSLDGVALDERKETAA
jgi:hypothetical protein